jgi:DNA recombination protein RmuC
MQMENLGWIVAVLAVVLAVFGLFVAGRGRRALQEQATAGQSAAAVAESRLVDLAAAHATLNEAHRALSAEHLALSGERESLRTSLAKTTEDLRRAVVESNGLRQSLEQSVANATRFDSDLRVAVANNANLTQRVEALETRVRGADEANRLQADRFAEVAAQAKALETQRDALLAQLAEQKNWVVEQTRFFEEKVTTVTARLMEERSLALTEVNKREMDAVVLPFKTQLEEFRQRVDQIHTTETRERGQLHEQIVQLTNLNQTVSQRAEELTNALTITSKSTGDWGETIMRRILEDSGLKEGREYSLQHSIQGEDGERLQPDAVVFLPENRQVIVDSKASNKAWKEYCAAADEATRALHLAAHVASLRAHIRGLSAKKYEASPDLHTVDFVLMFVPVEGALLTAFQHDDTLYTDAYRSKIILVTPSTLMAVLKLVEGMWQFQKRKESADKIADAGKRLYEKLTTFANTFLEVGEAIEKAHGTFEKAKGQLSTGRGNAIRIAQQMVELGVAPATGKVLPAELVQSAGEAETDVEEVAKAGETAALPGRDVAGELLEAAAIGSVTQ